MLERLGNCGDLNTNKHRFSGEGMLFILSRSKVNMKRCPATENGQISKMMG